MYSTCLKKLQNLKNNFHFSKLKSWEVSLLFKSSPYIYILISKKLKWNKKQKSTFWMRHTHLKEPNELVFLTVLLPKDPWWRVETVLDFSIKVWPIVKRMHPKQRTVFKTGFYLPNSGTPLASCCLWVLSQKICSTSPKATQLSGYLLCIQCIQKIKHGDLRETVRRTEKKQWSQEKKRFRCIVDGRKRCWMSQTVQNRE